MDRRVDLKDLGDGMRIGLIIEYLAARGGSSRQALMLARHLQQRGHQVRVLTRVWDREACFPDLTEGLQIEAVHRVDRTQPERTPSRFKAAVRTVLDATGITYLRQLRAMERATRELTGLLDPLVRDHSLDVLNPHEYGPAAWAAARVSERSGVPWVWQCNDPFLRWDRKGENSLSRAFRRGLVAWDRKRVGRPDAVTVLDTQVARVVEQRHGIAPTVVRSGVDMARLLELPARSEARLRWDLPPDKPVLLVLSLLTSPHRRVEDAIAAHAKLEGEPWLFLVAPRTGASDYLTTVDRAARDSPARDRIRWLDRPLSGEEELRLVYAASDVFVFPNVNQTWGLSVIEAAAAGRAVVVSSGAGSHEVFRHGEDALVFPGGNVEALAVALQTLLGDPDQRARIAAAGQRMVAASFSWDSYAEAMEHVMTDAMAGAENPDMTL